MQFSSNWYLTSAGPALTVCLWLLALISYPEGSSNCKVGSGAAAKNLSWYKQVPLPALIALFSVQLFIFVMPQTEFGRRIYAIGSNHTAARVSGI